MSIPRDPRKPFVYVQKKIRPLDEFPSPPLHVILYRGNQHAIVLFPTRCALLNLRTEQVERSIFFGNVGTVPLLYPFNGGFCFSNDQEKIFEVNEHFEVRERETLKDEQTRQYIFFSKHGYLQSSVTSKAYYNMRYLWLGCYFSGESGSERIVLKKLGTIEFKQLRTGKIIGTFPFQDVILLCCSGENEIICYRYNKKGSLWKVSLEGTVVKDSRKLGGLPQSLQAVLFHKINRQVGLVMFQTCNEVCIYDYNVERVVLRFGTPILTRLYDSVSQDLSVFVRKSDDDNMLYYYRLTTPRKLRMHLFKHSGMETLYGGEAVLRKVILLDDSA